MNFGVSTKPALVYTFSIACPDITQANKIIIASIITTYFLLNSDNAHLGFHIRAKHTYVVY